MEDYINYEKLQNSNIITKFLHSYRYIWILSIFRQLAKETNNKTITVVDIGCGTCKLFKVLNDNSISISWD